MAEQFNQIGVGFDAIGFAGFDERVEIRAGMSSGHRVAEQPVAATQTRARGRVFPYYIWNYGYAQAVKDWPRSSFQRSGVVRGFYA